MDDVIDVAALARRLDALEARNEALAAENRDLRARLDDRLAPSAPPSAEPDADAAADPGAPVGRRSLLRGGLAAGAAAAAAAVLIDGSPAAAANGGPLLMGNATNTSSASTIWTMTGESQLNISGAAGFTSVFEVESASGNSTATGLFLNNNDEGAGVKGSNSGSGVGVYGTAPDGQGVRGFSINWFGVVGESPNGTGVVGTGPVGVSGNSSNAAGSGVAGTNSAAGPGVVGSSATGTGVKATSTSGTALTATVTGPNATALKLTGRVPVDMTPQAGPPTTGAHTAGQMWMEGDTIDGTLWLCVSSGTPGLWRKVGGLETSGALHVLAAPARVYDSRPGTAPTSVGPKTKFAANETRTFDLKANASTVPAGASAALVTILLVNASTTAGNLTIWANGVAKPLANTMVWGGTAGRFTATATTALDTLARVQVNASQPTDLVLDVVGYYR